MQKEVKLDKNKVWYHVVRDDNEDKEVPLYTPSKDEDGFWYLNGCLYAHSHGMVRHNFLEVECYVPVDREGFNVSDYLSVCLSAKKNETEKIRAVHDKIENIVYCDDTPDNFVSYTCVYFKEKVKVDPSALQFLPYRYVCLVIPDISQAYTDAIKSMLTQRKVELVFLTSDEIRTYLAKHQLKFLNR